MARLTNKKREQLQQELQLNYVERDVTNIDDLVKILGVSKKTIYDWIKELNLDKLKRNLLLTYEEQLAHLLNELVNINNYIKSKPEGERFADYKEAQIRRSITKDIEALKTKDAQLPEKISALTDFLNFVRKNSLDEAQQVADLVDAFIKYELRK
ncbi:MAG: transcriptional regulator [Tenacibaculum sp.]|nr:transcriptional regulator [Tenacibaculum sp.]